MCVLVELNSIKTVVDTSGGSVDGNSLANVEDIVGSHVSWNN